MFEQNKDFLTIGFTAGTRAIDNYDRCCSLFGFKRALRGNFASQKPLYAKNATQEGYSVWMLAHSSLNESFNRNRRWYNLFVYPDIIREIWFNPSEYIEDPSIRACFAKNNSGNYSFKGVYKPIKAGWEEINGKSEWVRTFQLISKVYPTEKDVIDTPPHTKYVTISPIKDPKELSCVTDKCQIKAFIKENNRDTTVNVDISLRPFQKALIGKKVGDKFKLPNVDLTYEIKKILMLS